MQVFQCDRTILTCCQIFFYHVTFAVHFCAISSYDIRSGIHVIHCIFLSTILISKYGSIFTDICSCQNLSFFIDGKFCTLLFVYHNYRRCLTDYQINIRCSCTYRISLWCCDFFQINSILCLDDCYRGFSILICGRHLSDQVGAGCIAVYAKYRTFQIDISCIIFLYDFNGSLFNPGHFKINIFFVCYTLTKHQS